MTSPLNNTFKSVVKKRFITIDPNLAVTLTKNKKTCKLTKREQDILYYLSLYMSRKEIAQQLNISPSTVVSIIAKNLYPKFGVYTVHELIKKAFLLQMINF